MAYLHGGRGGGGGTGHRHLDHRNGRAHRAHNNPYGGGCTATEARLGTRSGHGDARTSHFIGRSRPHDAAAAFTGGRTRPRYDDVRDDGRAWGWGLRREEQIEEQMRYEQEAHDRRMQRMNASRMPPQCGGGGGDRHYAQSGPGSHMYINNADMSDMSGPFAQSRAHKNAVHDHTPSAQGLRAGGVSLRPHIDGHGHGHGSVRASSARDEGRGGGDRFTGHPNSESNRNGNGEGKGAPERERSSVARSASAATGTRVPTTPLFFGCENAKDAVSAVRACAKNKSFPRELVSKSGGSRSLQFICAAERNGFKGCGFLLIAHYRGSSKGKKGWYVAPEGTTIVSKLDGPSTVCWAHEERCPLPTDGAYVSVEQQMHNSVIRAFIDGCAMKQESKGGRVEMDTRAYLAVFNQTTYGAAAARNRRTRTATLAAIKKVVDQRRGSGVASYASLVPFLSGLLKGNPGSHVSVEVDDGGRFRSCFVAIGSVLQAVQDVGRKYSAIDAAHVKGCAWQGIILLQAASFADGTLVTVWFAVVTGFETSAAWAYCAEQFKLAGGGVLLSADHLVWSDRLAGCADFVEHFDSPIAACGKHLLMSCLKRMTKQERRGWNDNLFWALQGSFPGPERDAAWDAVREASVKVFDFLQSLRAESWLLNDIIAGGNATCGTRTSNAAEQTNSAMLRHGEVASLLAAEVDRSCRILARQVEDDTAAALAAAEFEQHKKVAPPATKMLHPLVAALLINRLRRSQFVEYVSGAVNDLTGLVHLVKERSIDNMQSFQYEVDLGGRSCSCNRWQRDRVACPHALATARKMSWDVCGDDCWKLVGREYFRHALFRSYAAVRIPNVGTNGQEPRAGAPPAASAASAASRAAREFLARVADGTTASALLTTCCSQGAAEAPALPAAGVQGSEAVGSPHAAHAVPPPSTPVIVVLYHTVVRIYHEIDAEPVLMDHYRAANTTVAQIIADTERYVGAPWKVLRVAVHRRGGMWDGGGLPLPGGDGGEIELPPEIPDTKQIRELWGADTHCFACDDRHGTSGQHPCILFDVSVLKPASRTLVDASSDGTVTITVEAPGGVPRFSVEAQQTSTVGATKLAIAERLSAFGTGMAASAAAGGGGFSATQFSVSLDGRALNNNDTWTASGVEDACTVKIVVLGPSGSGRVGRATTRSVRDGKEKADRRGPRGDVGKGPAPDDGVEIDASACEQLGEQLERQGIVILPNFCSTSVRASSVHATLCRVSNAVKLSGTRQLGTQKTGSRRMVPTQEACGAGVAAADDAGRGGGRHRVPLAPRRLRRQPSCTCACPNTLCVY